MCSGTKEAKKESRDKYAARSIELLRKALKQSAIKPAQLLSDDLKALKNRPEFRRLKREAISLGQP